jgi:UDP-N-acetylglucosamine 2-epimerase (non-hydrolysing)
MAPLYHYLKKNKKFDVKLCVTSQHKEMLYQVLAFFNIHPDYDLDVMEPNQTLNLLSAKILSKFDPILIAENPDLVLVHGDTTTSSVSALAAFNRNIKVGHIEAGLRTYDKNAPFPEEINRQITSRIADYHFVPTKSAQKNLLSEGIKKEFIIVTGNTIVDALLWTKDKIDDGFITDEIKNLQSSIGNKKLILVTGHRRENFGKNLEEFCNAILEIAEDKNVEIVFPVHLNPNVLEPVTKLLSGNKNIHLIPPVAYPTMVWMMQKCNLIISDSGGIQEEAPTFNKKVLVTRDISERPEGILAGFSILVGSDQQKIIENTKLLLKNTNVIKNKNPYGDGTASKKISTWLNKNLL